MPSPSMPSPSALPARRRAPRAAGLAAAALLLPAAMGLAGCSSSSSASGGGASGGSGSTAVTVSFDDAACSVSPTTAPAGSLRVTATYTGSSTAEVYLYGKDGDAFSKVVGEVEDLTPGLTKSFEAAVAAGPYEVACKAGGKDIRTPITVS